MKRIFETTLVKVQAKYLNGALSALNKTIGIDQSPSKATIRSINININELLIPKMGAAKWSFSSINKKTKAILITSKGIYVFVVNKTLSLSFDCL